MQIVKDVSEGWGSRSRLTRRSEDAYGLQEVRCDLAPGAEAYQRGKSRNRGSATEKGKVQVGVCSCTRVGERVFALGEGG